MLSLGSLAFLQPWVLLGLVALPAIWWLLRFTPPRPRVQVFPPLRLLLDLARTEETPDRSPWWLTLLRMTVAGLVIIAFAQPVLNPSDIGNDGDGPLAIVVDNGWAAADTWDQRRDVVADLIENAARRDRQVVLAATAEPGELAVEQAEIARRTLDSLLPAPYAPDRSAVIEALRQSLDGLDAAHVVWIADGIDYGGGAAFSEALSEIVPDTRLTVYSSPAEDSALWMPPARLVDGDLEVTVRRTDGSGRYSGQAVAHALNGRLIDRQPFVLDGGETEAAVTFNLPSDLRNQVARIEILAEQSAGAVTLLDERWQRRVVAMISGGSVEIAQPLLAPLYYVERALQPFAELRRPSFGEAEPMADDLIEDGLSMLVLADVGTLIESEREAITNWVEDGGMLVRFAGPRLAAGGDSLLPVELRRGGRSLGGSLSWAEPQRLSPFDDSSPFAGLPIPEDVSISRQVLAEPDVGLTERTWARLEDGTPLVTASPLGNGQIVLFHVTANADWSDLPLSGLFLDMMQRLLSLAQTTPGSRDAAGVAAEFLNPSLVLDGRGRLASPPPTAEPIARTDLSEIAPGPRHPPGFYGPTSARYALNTIAEDDTFEALDVPDAAQSFVLGADTETPLLPWLIAAALALLIADSLAVLALAGHLFGRRPGGLQTARTAAGILAVACVVGLSPHARAQDAETSIGDEFALRAALTTRLAYVETGNASVDATSEAGLHGLSVALRNRTALEPGAPMSVNVERDDLVFFPVIYWPVLPDAEAPSETAIAKLDTYMKRGGTIIFDTRDEVNAVPGVLGARQSPSLEALQRVLAQLDIPPLQPVPANHVLTKAFYLLQAFPGRFEGGPLWVEASGGEQSGPVDPASRGNADGVSSIIIGSNDYAGAWAIDPDGQALLPTSSGDPRQREMAYRVGINIVMYALTGNYKADQVHIPALLERLGQ